MNEQLFSTSEFDGLKLHILSIYIEILDSLAKILPV